VRFLNTSELVNIHLKKKNGAAQGNPAFWLKGFQFSNKLFHSNAKQLASLLFFTHHNYREITSSFASSADSSSSEEKKPWIWSYALKGYEVHEIMKKNNKSTPAGPKHHL